MDRHYNHFPNHPPLNFLKPEKALSYQLYLSLTNPLPPHPLSLSFPSLNWPWLVRVFSLSFPYLVPSCFLFTQTNPYFILLFFSLSVEGEWGNRVGWWIIDINAGVKDNTEDLNRAAVAGNYFQNLRGDIWHLVSMDLTSHIRRVTIEWLWVIVYQYFVISIIILQKHSLKKLSKDILFSLLSSSSIALSFMFL